MIPNDPPRYTRSSLVDAFAAALEEQPDVYPPVLLARMLGVAEPCVIARGDVEQVWAAWLTSTGRRARLDEKRRRLIRQRLRVFPVAELVAAVRGWRHDPFSRGENDRHRAYNDLELLLRDAAHIERFRDLEVASQHQPDRATAGETLRLVRERHT